MSAEIENRVGALPSLGIKISIKNMILRVLSMLGRRLDKTHISLILSISKETTCLCP